jgi:hypothetical protein
MDWVTGVQSPTEAEDFSFALCIQASSGAHPASCTMGTGRSFPEGKVRPGQVADHSAPSSAKVKKERELYLLSPHAPPWRVVGQLYFTFDWMVAQVRWVLSEGICVWCLHMWCSVLNCRTIQMKTLS